MGRGGCLWVCPGGGVLTAIGLDFNFLVWIIGIVATIVVAVVVLRFDIPKYAIIVITAVGGTSVIICTLLVSFGNLPWLRLLANPVRLAIENSFWWLLFFLVVAGAGIFFQIKASQAYDVEAYNRYGEW